MYFSVISVKPLSDYRLLVGFENDEKKLFDCSTYLKTGKFSELKNLNIFNSVKVSFDSIEWSNGLDLDPEILYKHGLTVAQGDEIN